MIIKPRKATERDLMLYFDWANETDTRKNSFSSEKISLDTHKQWFLSKINDENACMIIFENESNAALGQVRIEKKTEENIIGISIAKEYRGLGLAKAMIVLGTEEFFEKFENEKEIQAYIKVGNEASKKSFLSAGFELLSQDKEQYKLQLKRKTLL